MLVRLLYLPIFQIFSLYTRIHLRKDNHRLSSELQKTAIPFPSTLNGPEKTVHIIWASSLSFKYIRLSLDSKLKAYMKRHSLYARDFFSVSSRRSSVLCSSNYIRVNTNFIYKEKYPGRKKIDLYKFGSLCVLVQNTNHKNKNWKDIINTLT
ncbi:hypothetical protein H8356DRAFT_1436790 [Neocallimastix lanati (nom. inval.)]|nr:hypothetical protein H8356DRAFT_1436790 [Neocallimastix sp. JGI-2020a]